MEWAKKESEKSKETSISRVNAWLHVSLCKDVYTFNVCWLWKECIARLITIIFAKLKIFMFLKDFYWSIVALQCCASFYCTAKWISYRYTHIPSFLFLSHLGHHGALSRVPEVMQYLLICCLWEEGGGEMNGKLGLTYIHCDTVYKIEGQFLIHLFY